MFEHWRQVAYYDNENAVFPSEELMDLLEIHDTYPRRVVSKALTDFAEDFNALLVERRIYDWFYQMCYNKVRFHGESVLFS